MSDDADGEQTPPAPAEVADEGSGEERRPRLLPVWILLGAAVLSGGAWAVTDRLEGGPPADEAQVPLVTASAEPWKVRPDDPGGMEIPNRGTLIYETLTTADPEEAPERILPPPEEPLSPPEPEPADELAETPPVAASDADAPLPADEPASLTIEEAPLMVEQARLPEPDATEEAAPVAETAELAPDREAAPEEPVTQDTPEVVLPPPPKPRPSELVLADATQPSEAERHEAQTPVAVEETGQPEPEAPTVAGSEEPQAPEPDAPAAPLQPEDADPVPVPVDKPVRVARAGGAGETAAAAPLEQAPLTGGKWRYVQLGTAGARGPLEAHWEMLRRRHDDALIGLSPLIMPVDRGEEGIMYRLRAGPLSDEEMARWVCARLKARGLECFVPRD